MRKMKSDQIKLNQPELAAYEIKFENFIKMCSKKDIDVALITHRYVLGDTAKEFDESIRRLKNAGLKLSIAQENRIYECAELDSLEF